MADTDAARELLRHCLATLAYRAGKAVRDAPESFASLRPFETTRTPAQILAHLGDLMDWALHLAKGEKVWNDSTPLPWAEEAARFFAAVARLDAHLASPAPLAATPEKLFQGPIADALTHVGQLTLLRRMGGAAVRGENYFVAEVEKGRVGSEQRPPRREFD